MLPVALFDTVEIDEAPELSVCHSPALSIPSRYSTVWQAATHLAQVLGENPSVSIMITAKIPQMAGLGGSSADAGVTLRLLAERWGLAATDERVVQVARQVGADVAFFLTAEPGLYRGTGDTLEYTFPAWDMPVALVMPAHSGVSTKEAYELFDKQGTQPHSCASMGAALEACNSETVAHELFNNLESCALQLNHEVRNVRIWLGEQIGVMGAQVTGSGGCSFALCETVEVAERIARDAHRCGWRAWATHTLDGPLWS